MTKEVDSVLLIPKLKYRFRVLFEQFGNEVNYDLTKHVISSTRPKLIGVAVNWLPITVSLRDDVNNVVTKLVQSQLKKQIENLTRPTDYKFIIIIEMLDKHGDISGPKVLERWKCEGCILTEVNYGNLDYSENKPVEITLTIHPDICIQIFE